MTATTILILVLIGIAAGLLSGLVGVGGGIVIVPALVYLLAFTQKQAQGTSLAILLLPIGILAVLNYYKDPAVHLDIKVVALIIIGFLAGSYYGSKLALSLPDTTVKKVFAIFMLLVAIKMLFIDKPKPTAPGKEKITAEKMHE
ncbi:MAG TPA: sulfite exporter TauE/SafE family protein [Chitinophagaceae bacterium]